MKSILRVGTAGALGVLYDWLFHGGVFLHDDPWLFGWAFVVVPILPASLFFLLLSRPQKHFQVWGYWEALILSYGFILLLLLMSADPWIFGWWFFAIPVLRVSLLIFLLSRLQTSKHFQIYGYFGGLLLSCGLILLVSVLYPLEAKETFSDLWVSSIVLHGFLFGIITFPLYLKRADAVVIFLGSAASLFFLIGSMCFLFF